MPQHWTPSELQQQWLQVIISIKPSFQADWIALFPVSTLPRSFCLSVCPSIHQCVPSDRTVKATHLTSGQLSKQDTPFTLTPGGGRRLTIHSMPWVNLFTFGIDPEHCWHTGLLLEWDEYIIHIFWSIVLCVLQVWNAKKNFETKKIIRKNLKYISFK